ncbi:MAG: hypothetical protein DHS20C15_21770 [Planctomycetota bacterium]|nr:MAG: hypothetical protein DHS20C15_21770 [Planctomycetota bacterium]
MLIHCCSKTVALALPLCLATACVMPPAAQRPKTREQQAPTRNSSAEAPGSGGSVPSASTPQDQALDLLAMLVESGALTPEQYAALSEDPRFAEFTGAAPPASTPVMPAAAAEPGGQPRVILDDSGLSVRSADGETRIDIGGRIQADASAHSRNGQAGTDITDGTELRRARLEMKGAMRNGWIWAAEADFADDATSLKDFWMGVKNDDGSKLMFGHQKQPFSLAVEMSSNDIPFTERGADASLIAPFVDRAIGVRYEKPFEDSFFAAGLFGESVAANKDDDEGWGAAARFVHAPIHDDEEVLHFGVRGAFRKPMSSTKSVRIRHETTHASNFYVVDTGTLAGVDSAALAGLEFAYVTGPLSFAGEWSTVMLDRSMGDVNFDGWSLESAYSLTGESRAEAYRMSAGEFKRLKPARDAQGLDLASGGAWELAARVSNIDLNDGAVAGGEANMLTTGVNWYPTDFTRFLFGWTNVLSTRGGSAATNDADGLDAITLRAQMTF